MAQLKPLLSQGDRRTHNSPGRQGIQHMANIANATGIPELILRTIRTQANKIEERCNKCNVHANYKDHTKWGAEYEEKVRMLAQ
jgi:hypothetical protein